MIVSYFSGLKNEKRNMKHILKSYEAAYGQAISLNKSKGFYCSSIPTPLKEVINTILGVRVVMGRVNVLVYCRWLVEVKEKPLVL